MNMERAGERGHTIKRENSENDGERERDKSED